MLSGNRMKRVLIALGSNLASKWGSPVQTLRHAAGELERSGIIIQRSSALYRTEPVGMRAQASYLNAVLLARVSFAPARLLLLLKRMERRSGRRSGRHWGPRPLDLDIIDFAGRVCGWPPSRRLRGQLVLPHPEAHRRAFVLVPLIDVMPAWRHPVLGQSARALLARTGTQRRGVKRILDSGWISCQEITT